jgi:hypothetical protein
MDVSYGEQGSKGSGMANVLRSNTPRGVIPGVATNVLIGTVLPLSLLIWHFSLV